MRLNKSVCALVLAYFFVAGCSSTDEMDSGLIDGAKGGAADASTSGYTDGSTISGTEMQAIDSAAYDDQQYGSDGTPSGPEFSDPQNPLSQRIIYFMYDSSQVQQDFIAVINAHAQYLIAHSNQRMILEGHADERGSREYNIALGEQRAKAVARIMKAQGVSPAQLEIVSYGEEKPIVFEQDEASWQQNRRVELVYQG